MATKQKVNKSQAVRDYLKTHPKAVSSEIAEALTKRGITITQNHVATIKTIESWMGYGTDGVSCVK